MPTTSPPEALRIGVLAARTGTTAPSVRYYEDIGLPPPAGRRECGQRRYGPEEVRRLTRMRRSRESGFSVHQPRELVALVADPARDGTAARDAAPAHVDAVRGRLAALQALARSIADCGDRSASAGAGAVSFAPLAAASARGRATAPTGRP